MKQTISILFLLTSSTFAAYSTTCSAGWYLAGGNVCNFCTPGQYCQGGTRQNFGTCGAGTYSGFGSSTCTACPAGYFCPNTGSPPFRCQVNTGSYQGSTQCTTPPNGYYATWNGIFTACSPGQVCYWNGVNSYTIQRFPRTCRAGYYCNGITETACPSGTYSLAGAQICTSIQPGQFFVSSSHPPGTCGDGYYQQLTRATVTQCYQCSAGNECPSITLPPNACQIGYFAPYAGMKACIQCPAGMYCDVAQNWPLPCTFGQYSQAGWVQCAPCPAGYACPDASIKADGTDTCASGWYSKAGDGLCTQCPAGYSCIDATLAPIACFTGYYSAPGATACTLCPAGSICPQPTNYPAYCPQGQWSQAGAIACMPCPRGSVCLPGTPLPAACSVGQITSHYSTPCQNCPAGYACPLGMIESIVPCQPGYYSPAGSATCEIAPAGTFAPTTQLTPTTVSARYYADVGFTYQTRCPPGWNCLDTTGRHNVLCKSNQYTDATNGCTDCPAGTFCQPQYAMVAFFTTTGVPCVVGTWSFQAMTYCEVCAPGKLCSSLAYPSGSTLVPATCPSTSYQIGGNNVCTPCPLNHECSNSETLAPCPIYHTSAVGGGDCVLCGTGMDCTKINYTPTSCGAGWYRGVGDVGCQLCPRGHYCGGSSSSSSTYLTTATPTQCPAGQYSNDGEASCSLCQSNFYSNAASEYCTPVPPGFMATLVQGPIQVCPHMTYSEWGGQTCLTCPNGYLCPEKTDFGYMTELSCPRGSYCIAGVQTLCPDGTYGVKERGISQADACATCPPGYNCVAGTENFLLAPCPIGAYCPGGSSMVACPSGTTNSNQYSKSTADCITCQPGQSCGNAVAGPVQASAGSCDQGYFCPQGGAYHQYPCPAGTYGAYRTGKQDISECLACPPGSYCPQATAAPIPAPSGYYSPLPGLDSLAALTACPPKFYCPNTGQTYFKGQPCIAGYYCPSGSSTAASLPPCPQGTFSDRTDLFDPLQCTICPKGFFCNVAFTSAQVLTNECPINSYCPYGTWATAIPKCPAGTYNTYTRSMSLNDCLQCPAGSYCLTGASPVTCVAGYYCPAGTQFAIQYPCPFGYYSPSLNTGLIDSSQCLQCGIGKYCNSQAMLAPLACPAGSYNDYSTTAIICSICPAGSYCTSANVHPQLCPVGTYSDVGATLTTCPSCFVGSYCPLPGTSKTVMLTQLCPAGTFCSQTVLGVAVGLSTYPNKLAQPAGNACSPNFYCPRGTQTQIPIIAGTAQLVYGAGYSDQQIQLPDGFSDPTMLTGCPAGAYCPAGSVTLNSAGVQVGTPVLCPAGTYRGNTFGKDISDCGICPAGYYCGTAGTVTPVVCPAGYYCPEGSKTIQPCPAGTYWTGTTNAITGPLFGVAAGLVFGLPDSASCTPCDQNYFCPYRGMIAANPALICDNGFVCISGSSRPEPTDYVTGNICPAGSYCSNTAVLVNGVSTLGQVPCAPGTNGFFQAASTVSACKPCQPGYYCKGSGNTGSVTQCPAGYICPSTANIGTIDYAVAVAGVNTPNQPAAGYFSSIGMEIQKECAIGYYNKVAGQSSCTPCDQGYFCNQIALTDPSVALNNAQCPAGFYCLSYSTNQGESPKYGYRKYACPVGTYLNVAGKFQLSDCIPCPATYACETTGMSAVPSLTAQLCAAGFFCFLNSPSRFPQLDPSGQFGPCPAGSWCGVGTSTPTQCLAGTYSNQAGAISANFCLPCPPGWMCNALGLTAPTNQVVAGYLTTNGIITTQYSAATGQYVPIGSQLPLRCPLGMYQLNPGMGYCNYCQSGKFCMTGGQSDCPAGYWCP